MKLTVEPYPKKKSGFKQNDPYKRRALKTRGKRKVGTVSALQKRLDALFSQFVRYSAADSEGNARCYTCNHPYPVKKLHNGHYVLRGYKATRWDLDNCRPQCGVCNLWRKGEPVVFRENLVKELGEKRVLELEARRHIVTKIKAEWLQEQIDIFAEKVKPLLITLKI